MFMGFYEWDCSLNLIETQTELKDRGLSVLQRQKSGIIGRAVTTGSLFSLLQTQIHTQSTL